MANSLISSLLSEQEDFRKSIWLQASSRVHERVYSEIPVLVGPIQSNAVDQNQSNASLSTLEDRAGTATATAGPWCCATTAALTRENMEHKHVPSAFSVSLMAEYNVCTQTNAQTSTGPGDGAANCVATTTVAQRCESISEKFPQLLPLIHSPAFADVSRKKQLALPLPAVRIPPVER